MISLACVLMLTAIFFDAIAKTWLDLTATFTFPLLMGALISAVLGYIVIPVLQRLKTGQIVQEDGPQTHLKRRELPQWGEFFLFL